ncbi:MAG: formylglycine-generating enzyme family protein, partial [Xanthobacteraceae bacterium]
LNALATAPDRIPVLIGNSGVGKSSLAQAGVLAALKRQAWPENARAPGEWPDALKDSRRWYYFTLRPGTEPIKTLVEMFLETWQLDRTSTDWPQRRADWVEKLIGGKLTLRDLLDQSQRRYAELQHPGTAAFFLYIDQGEELYVRAEERQRRRLSELLAQALGDRSLYGLMSLRADFFGELQKDEPLYKIHQLINVPPLREAELRDVVSRPAELLSARFENDHLAADIARHAAEESAKDAGALPLLSYFLDDMWTKMVHQGDGVLRLSTESIELGGVLVDRADAFLAAHPNSEEKLRRISTLKLATVRQGEEPTRRRALRSEFTDEEWRLVSDLADHPNRLLITATPEGSETYAEVAHEAIFRRWDKLRAWIAAEREFLAWRSGLEAARRAWQEIPESERNEALLMGLALAQAQNWFAKRSEDIPAADHQFIVQSRKAAQQRRRRIAALVGVPAFAMIVGLIGWVSQDYVEQTWRQFAIIRPYMLKQVRPYVLSAQAERALKPGDTFTECAANCPQMVVVPAGQFVMGSPATEPGHNAAEEPQHTVTIAKPFAVAKFEATFAEWDACAAYGDCNPDVSDSGRGRGNQPVINVDWEDAKRYAAWLSRMTGNTYRLLSESEWEYAARGGTQTAYSWGNDVGKGNADCIGCGSQWDDKQAAPDGSFPPNPFGLYDMEGNVWEWVEDCVHDNYNGAPDDGTAWMAAGCESHVVRGGSWLSGPLLIRTANRVRPATGNRGTALGFRVARTLNQ